MSTNQGELDRENQAVGPSHYQCAICGGDAQNCTCFSVTDSLGRDGLQNFLASCAKLRATNDTVAIEASTDRMKTTLSRVPETPIRLAPEQTACPHSGKWRWAGLEGVFRCSDCGAPIVCPELSEIIGLEVASEPLEPEHADDGTRQHESASYQGTVFVCLCGERFVDRNDLHAHICA